MADISKTNVCCLDLNEECINYIKSLDLDVYVGSLGSVFTIDWSKLKKSYVYILNDIHFPANLHEYHIFIVDTDNPHIRPYSFEDHKLSQIDDPSARCLICSIPQTILDLRPYGTYRLDEQFRYNSKFKRLNIIFLGEENFVEYSSDRIDYSDQIVIGTFSNFLAWNICNYSDKFGKRIKIENNKISKILFDGRLNKVRYYHTFSLRIKEEDDNSENNPYLPLLYNESGECISYLYIPDNDTISFVLPQVEDKAAFLKDLFEGVLFPHFSEFFPDIEANSWIHQLQYQLPEVMKINEEIELLRKECDNKIAILEGKASQIEGEQAYLKEIITESGSNLVSSVKSFLEWLGFENVIDKDDTLNEGELREEDLAFEYEGTHIYIEVKGINGTSTDNECSQIDKVVSRRMRELKTTDVHGIYIVNNQRNVELIKRQTPPFNEVQIKDAVNQERTMIYTAQLFALYSDIENGYITKEFARKQFLKPGLADFQSQFVCLGKPYRYCHDISVICIELNDVKVSVGDMLFFKDPLQKLVGFKVISLEQDHKQLESVSSGNTGLKIDMEVPRNRDIFVLKKE